MRRWLPLLLLSCRVPPGGACPFPEEPSPLPEDALDLDDHCGYWSLPMDEHMYVNITVSSFDVACEVTVPDDVALFAEPTYSSFEGQSRWTFDFVGVHTDHAFADVTIACADDAIEWLARVRVE